jgi:AraC-like DNA-binding protein/effector-binding domain-containing protein
VPDRRSLLQVLRTVAAAPERDHSLSRIAVRSGWSRFHLHRAWREAFGETPKQLTLRLRLERAAAALAVRPPERVLAVALAAGFLSHEVFARAFRRRFGRTPRAYRGFALHERTAAERQRHRDLVRAIGPCVGLFRSSAGPSWRPTMPALSLERRDLPSTPVVFVRFRRARHELPAAIAEGAGRSYLHAQSAGLAIVGHPYTRFLSTGPGLLTFEVGVPLAKAGAGAGEVEAGVLPSGPAACAVHSGPYDGLPETYAALERWMEAEGLRPSGPPWEAYLTDPADHPDPADWRTEVCWPIEV